MTLANHLGHFFPGHDDPDNDTVAMASGACHALCRIKSWCDGKDMVVWELRRDVKRLQARVWELEDASGPSPNLLRQRGTTWVDVMDRPAAAACPVAMSLAAHGDAESLLPRPS